MVDTKTYEKGRMVSFEKTGQKLSQPAELDEELPHGGPLKTYFFYKYIIRMPKMDHKSTIQHSILKTHPKKKR